MKASNSRSEISPRRRLAPEGRRRELLDAGLKVIRSKKEQAKISDVIAEAATARGTFYVYFADWSDYLLQLRDYLGQQLAGRFAEESEEYNDWRSFWAAVPELFVRLTLELDGLEILYHGPLAARAGEDALTRKAIQAFVQQTAAAGAMAPLNPDLVAPLVYAVVHETIESVLDGVDAEAASAACGEFIVAALAVQPRDRSTG